MHHSTSCRETPRGSGEMVISPPFGYWNLLLGSDHPLQHGHWWDWKTPTISKFRRATINLLMYFWSQIRGASSKRRPALQLSTKLWVISGTQRLPFRASASKLEVSDHNATPCHTMSRTLVTCVMIGFWLFWYISITLFYIQYIYMFFVHVCIYIYHI